MRTRDSDPPTLWFRAPCPRDAVLVLFKYVLEKAAFPACRWVRSWNGAGREEGTLVLYSARGRAGTKIQHKATIWARSPLKSAEPEQQGLRAGVAHGTGSVARLVVPKPHVSERTVDGSKPHNLGQSKLSKG